VANVESARFAWDEGTVSGAWHHPPREDTYLILGHGAGGNMHTPGMAQVAEALAARGVGVVRFNFPYAEAKRKVPDRQPALERCYHAVAEQVAARAARLFLGGRSMGGRIASHIVAAGRTASGLVFLSYPLHPPGRPERLRDAHLYGITAPMLFVQGTNDAFAQPDLLARTLERLPNATLHRIEDADHGLKVRGRPADAVTAEIAETVATWIG
jgi:predicted alpha/beta-hydrolase family hydrolase